MKKFILPIFVIFANYNFSFAQIDHEKIKKDFLADLHSGKLEDGCKIIVSILSTASTTACVIPEPSVSKVACSMALILNFGNLGPYQDPNVSTVTQDALTKVCQFSYAATKSGYKFTIDFTKNQINEINETWAWLNTLEGAVFFMDYLSK